MIIPALLVATAIVAGAAILKSKEDEDKPPIVEPPERGPSMPPITEVPMPALSIPPSVTEIPGGTYVDGKGWCPPMYQYDPVTGLCAPIVIAEFPFPIQNLNLAQTSGACCDSCAHGGPCTGCK